MFFPRPNRPSLAAVKYKKTLAEQDQDRGARNLVHAAAAGGLAGVLARSATKTRGQRAGIGALAGAGAVLATRAITSHTKDAYGERPRGAKLAEKLPAYAGLGAAGMFAHQRYKKVMKKLGKGRFFSARSKMIELGVVSVGTAKKVLRGLGEQAGGRPQLLRPRGAPRFATYFPRGTPEAPRKAIMEDFAFPLRTRIKSHTVIVPRARGGKSPFPRFDVIGVGLHEHGHAADSLVARHSKAQLAKRSRFQGALAKGDANTADKLGRKIVGSEIESERRANQNVLKQIEIHGKPHEAVAWKKWANQQMKQGYRKPIYRDTVRETRADTLSKKKAVLRELPMLRSRFTNLASRLGAASLSRSKRHCVRQLDAPIFAGGAWKQRLAEVGGIAAGDLVGEAIHDSWKNRNLAKLRKKQPQPGGGSQATAPGPTQFARILTRKNLHELKSGPKQPYEQADPGAASGHHSEAQGRDEANRFKSAMKSYMDKSRTHGGSRVSFTDQAVLRSAWRKAADINRYGTRGTRIASDIHGAATGRAKVDSRGRPLKREWEKQWFKNTVRNTVIAGATLGGAAVLKHNPKFRAAVAKKTKKATKVVRVAAKKAGKGIRKVVKNVANVDKYFAAHPQTHHFDFRADMAGWDVRDPRGRSARVFAPGARARERRSKRWHEKVDTIRKVAIIGTVGALAGGTLAGLRVGGKNAERRAMDTLKKKGWGPKRRNRTPKPPGVGPTPRKGFKKNSGPQAATGYGEGI